MHCGDFRRQRSGVYAIDPADVVEVVKASNRTPDATHAMLKEHANGLGSFRITSATVPIEALVGGVSNISEL